MPTATGDIATGQGHLPAVDAAAGHPATADALTSGGMYLADPPLAPVAPSVPANVPDPGLFADVAAFVANHRDVLILGGLLLTALLLGLVIRRAIRGGRPDRWLDTFAVAVGFGWSVEGMWEVSGRLDLSIAFSIVAVVVFDSMMASSMLRAHLHQKEHGNPGRHATAMWVKAAIAGGIVAFASDQLFEVPLRLAIPLLVVYQFWLGLRGDGAVRDEGPSSWRWTPRRLLLWLGAIEPGERDMATVHRAARVKQMTELEFARRGSSWAWVKARRTAKLERLSLTADDAMIAEVEANVYRAGWMHRPRPVTLAPSAPGATPDTAPGEGPGTDPVGLPGEGPGVNPGGDAGDTPGVLVGVEAGVDPGAGAGVAPARVRVPARPRKQSAREVRALKLRADDPDMSAAEIARKVGADYKTVRGWLNDAKAAAVAPVAEPAPPVLAGVNGHPYNPTPDTPKE